MPFTSKKQKKTIDAAAHNPAFAKKVGIKVSDAKKMSAHGKGQTKFDEAKLDELSPKTLTSYKDKASSQVRASAGANPNKSHVATDPKIANRARGAVKADNRLNGFGPAKKVKEATDTVEKDEKGNVKSWKHEGDWKKADNKQGRGKVTNLSDKARRKTATMSKAEESMAEQFEKAMEGSIRGGVWTSQPPDKGQKDVPPPQEPDGGILNKKQPKPVNPPRKKAEGPGDGTAVAVTDDDTVTAGMKHKVGKKAKTVKEAVETINKLKSLIAEAKKLKGGQAKLDVAEPKGKLTGADFKALKGKKKTDKAVEDCSDSMPKKKTKEAVDQNKDGKNDFEDVKIARLKAAAKGKSKKVAEATKEKEPEGLYSKKRFETDSQRVARLAKEKRQAEKKKKEEVKESWTHDSLASQLFENDEYMMSLREALDKKLQG